MWGWVLVAIGVWWLLGEATPMPIATGIRVASPLAPGPAIDANGCIGQHQPLTGLDDASMIAAYAASFRGIFGREPTMQPGSGSDDGAYWIGQSNHFGAFSDSICRAGWSAYWEAKLAGADSVDPALGDQPAGFQP